MKKLMLTSALAGVLISSSAFAQTTVTGEIRVNLKSVGSSVATGTTTTSGRGFGTEQQLNIQTKGKLNVGGLDYAAGFSMENDGQQVGTLFNENSYIDFTNASSGTTLSLSQDHIQRSDTDRSAAVLVGHTPNELSSSGHASTRFSQNLGPAVGQSWTVSILQQVGSFGTLSYSYAPSLTNAVSDGGLGVATALRTGTSPSETFAEGDDEGGYEYGFVGSLGVKGLNAYYFNGAANAKGALGTIPHAQSYGASYNMGEFTIGYANKRYNANTTNLDTTEKHYGVAYAINNQATLGLIYGKADVESSSVTQKVKGINLGYALGPVDLTVSVARNTDIAGTVGNDSDLAMVRFIGKF